jgi:hypothetical protein
MVEPGTASAGIARTSLGYGTGPALSRTPGCPATGQPHHQVERLFRNYFSPAAEEAGRPSVAEQGCEPLTGR